MRTYLTLDFPAPLPVLRVRVSQTAPRNRMQRERSTTWFALLLSGTILACAATWFGHAEVRPVAIQSRPIAPAPALTASQWMSGLARG